jgi:hypothetical protein
MRRRALISGGAELAFHADEEDFEGLLEAGVVVGAFELIAAGVEGEVVGAAGVAGVLEFHEDGERAVLFGEGGFGDVDRPGVVVGGSDFAVGFDLAEVEDVVAVGTKPEAFEGGEVGFLLAAGGQQGDGGETEENDQGTTSVQGRPPSVNDSREGATIAASMRTIAFALLTSGLVWGQGAGPEVGQRIPGFEARDQEGRTQTFETLRGAKGLVLLFVRSADW